MSKPNILIVMVDQLNGTLFPDGPAARAKSEADVRANQARRGVVYDALRQGGYFSWDYQPLQKASERYMRNHMDLNDLEESQHSPRGH